MEVIRKLIVTLQNHKTVIMDINTNSALQQWLDNREQLMGIDGSATDVQYNEAIDLCNNLHKQLANEADRDEYIAFLSTYANLCALREENSNKEIEIQDEIVEVRRRQAEENRAVFLPKLSHSLFYAAQLHRKAANVHRAMECIEEHLTLERERAEQNPEIGNKDLALALYFTANMYAAFGRNILAEDTYAEAVTAFNELLAGNYGNDTDTSMLLAQIVIEYADFYLSTRMINNAIDRYIQAMEILRSIAPQSPGATALLKQQYSFMSQLYTQVGNEDMGKYYAQLSNEIN